MRLRAACVSLRYFATFVGFGKYRRLTPAALMVLAACGPSGPLPSGVTFVKGPANGVILEQNGRRVAIYGDPRPEPKPVEAVLLTHHRRDVVWEALPLAAGGAKVYAPAGERALFEDVDSYWKTYYEEGRFHDYAQQSSRVLAKPLAIDQRVAGDFSLFDGGLDGEGSGHTRLHAACGHLSVRGRRQALGRDGRPDLGRRPTARSVQPAGRHPRGERAGLPRLRGARGGRDQQLAQTAGGTARTFCCLLADR